MNNLSQELNHCLKALYLSTVRACYGEQAEQARREGWSYEQYLAQVLMRECETRRHNRIARLLRESKLPLVSRAILSGAATITVSAPAALCRQLSFPWWSISNP